jgi:hypothetical protein
MHYHLGSPLTLFFIALFGFLILSPSTTTARTISKELVNKSVVRTLNRRQQAIPEPPPDPPPKQGDGSASGTYCTASPTPLDYATKNLCIFLISLAQVLGYKNAESHMQYYLDGSGVDFNVEVEALIHDLPNFAAAAYTLVDHSAKVAYGHALVAPPETPITFQIPWKLYSSSVKGNFNPDWLAAEGSFSYSVSGVVKLKNGTNGNPGQAVLTYAVDMFDRYNWELGTSFTLDLVTVASGPIGRLNQVCLAQVYNVRGSTTLNVVDPYDPTQQPLPPIQK